MAQFASGGLSPANTDFQQVRAVNKTGRSNIAAKAISDVITGVSVFGKASAREAGVKAAEDQTGINLPLEQVNKDVDDLNESIAQGLATEKDAVEGPVNAKRVNELKDSSLREATLTDRHIQGLIDSGSISSTEGNARRRIELSKLKNRGSNFLFSDEFDNAFFSATGGTRGSAQAAIFPKTAEELREQAFSQARVKEEAEFEGRIAGAKRLFPEKSETDIRDEFAAQAIGEQRLKQLELAASERKLSQGEMDENINLTQANVTRSLELQIAELVNPNGLLEQGSNIVLENRIEQSMQAMLEKAAVSGLSSEKLEKDIKRWGEGQRARIAVLSKAKADKEFLDILQTGVATFGIKSNPVFTLLAAREPELAKALSKIPRGSQPRHLETFLGKDGVEALNKKAEFIKNLGVFSEGSLSEVTDPKDVVSSMSTVEARKNAGKKGNRSNWVSMFMAAPDTAMNTLSRIFSDGQTAPSDLEERNGNLLLLETVQKDTINKIKLLRSRLPIVTTTVSDLTGLERSVLTLSEELKNIPGMEDTLHDTWLVLKRNPWTWKDQGFDTPESAFNAYVTGGLSFDPDKFDTSGEGTVVKKKVDEKKQAEFRSQVKETLLDEPISVQNNNPANLRSFGDVETVETPSGTFVKFESKADGVRAAARNFQTKISRGDNTIEELINQQSPDSDPENIKRGITNEPFKEFISKAMGKKRDETLTENDLPKFLKALFAFESGNKSNITSDQIRQGIEDAKIDR